MPYLENEGIKIYYEVEGEGPPVIMIHGFSSNLDRNWKETGCVETLKKGYQLILLDCRGHGKSDKPHGDSYYGQNMCDDILKLMEHLSIERANLFGYSMGAFLTFQLLLTNPDVIISAILGGFVLTLNEKERSKDIKLARETIESLRADDAKQVKKPMARAFRTYAESRNNDLLALASVRAGMLEQQLKTMEPAQLRETLKNIHVPVMTIVGSTELLLGDKTLFAQLVPDACHFQIQGKDHLTVVLDPKFHMAVKAFLDLVNYNRVP